MKIQLAPKAVKSYQRAIVKIQKAFDKQTGLLASSLRHPSLHAKKYDEAAGIWQARINNDWRFYFLIENGIYIILDLSKHPK